jgi:hypothetical protein
MSLKLNDEEWSVFQDQRFMPLKQKVWQKMEAILHELARAIKTDLATETGALPSGWETASAKISRGENYQTYSYRVLDYPRVHQGQEFFFFRTLFLWGHPIGFHMIFSQEYRDFLSPDIAQRLKHLSLDWRLSAQDNPWLWEEAHPQLFPIADLGREEIERIVSARKFLKISRFLPLENYLSVPEEGKRTWRDLGRLWR